jgi:acyl-CoA thioesterase
MSDEKLDQKLADELRQKLKHIPYANLLGIELQKVTPGTATLSLEIKEELKRNNGIAHGGAIASLIDTATAFATLSVLNPDQRSTTIDLTINYLRPLIKGKATATAKVVRNGRRILAVSAEVFDESGNLAATALSSYIKD